MEEKLQSTSLLRGKTIEILGDFGKQVLQSTSLLRGKTNLHERRCAMTEASIHFPLAREDSKFHQKLPTLIL